MERASGFAARGSLRRAFPMTVRKLFLAFASVLALAAGPITAKAEDWGRFYHYPYSFFPQNYRRPFESRDFDLQYGYPHYPQYMAFPPYFRKDLYYPYINHMKPGGCHKYHTQGNHYVFDVF
jgi:hypothetical protein